MVRKLLFTALAFVALSATPALAQYPGIVVQPGRVNPGGTVTVTGKGCEPGATVTITMRKAPDGTEETVATITADEDGNFTISFKVPPGTPPGIYDVISRCGTVVQSQQIEVLGTSTTPTTPGTQPGGGAPGNLPRTGSNLNGVGLAGAGLLLVGGLFLLAARKRRSDQAVA